MRAKIDECNFILSQRPRRRIPDECFRIRIRSLMAALSDQRAELETQVQIWIGPAP